MEILDISQLATQFHIIICLNSITLCLSSFKSTYPQTLNNILNSNIVFDIVALCGVVFSNLDPASVITKAKVSDYTVLTQRHKMKAQHIMFLS